MNQISQIAGMRGQVADTKGETIVRPIKSNFREGLSVLEYFISTHGARKGLADTALRTADSGYLTRRLVDVSQDVIIRERDCGAERGIEVEIAQDGIIGEYVETSVATRTLAQDVEVDGNVVAAAGTDLTTPLIQELAAQGVEKIRVRSVMTCESKVGVCALCYGRSLATGKLVDVGEAVGIVAAQSIGEPGTQLTMRTFHTGGVAGEDITHGLPRVTELFEARTPKGLAPISRGHRPGEHRGDRQDPQDHRDPGRRLRADRAPGVEEGQARGRGRRAHHGRHQADRRCGGPEADPADQERSRAVQQHLVDQVQAVYRPQGVSIHDKHIEVIVRQMLKRVTIIEPGNSPFVTGDVVDTANFREVNRQVVMEGGTPASGRPELMGITKASLATESWLSAASFQETTRVLTEAAIQAKSDPLLGLKENVILGKLIPAGTGLSQYRNLQVQPTQEARDAVYAQYRAYDDFSYGHFDDVTGASVPLDDTYMGEGSDYR
jgi:DNA-directed RNA polymerase subunit beta'